MSLDLSQQASNASLQDHEDYTRPINGVCLLLLFFSFSGAKPNLLSMFFRLLIIIFETQLLHFETQDIMKERTL